MLVSYAHMYDSGKRDEFVHMKYTSFCARKQDYTGFKIFSSSLRFCSGKLVCSTAAVESLRNLSLNVSNVIFICPIFLLSYLYVEVARETLAVALVMSEYAGCLTDLDELR